MARYSRGSSRALFPVITEIIEGGDAVRFGPDANCTGPIDVVVVGFDVAFAVERDVDPASGKLDAQRVPLVACDRRIDVFDRDAPTVARVIERDVVLERIRSRDVIVVAVLPAPHDAAGLIFGARNRLESDLDVAVGDRNVAPDAPREVAADRKSTRLNSSHVAISYAVFC